MVSVQSTFCLLFILILITRSSAQAPRGNGRDRSFIGALRRRGARRMCRRVEIRTLDGECTSRRDPSFGQARLSQFSYVTGSSSRIPTGQGRRSARDISNIIFNQERSVPNSRGLNQLFVFFGQFVDHNFAATPESEEEMSIPVSPSDPELSVSSLPFKRSERGEINPGSSAQRPINILTSAIDLVAVYGPNEMRNRELRETDTNGNPSEKLRTSNGDLLPLNTGGFSNDPNPSANFFLAGDLRSNEHPVLTSMHTIFLREHNRLCDVIKSRLPSLSSEDVYNFARSMNIAQFQKIVFEEFYQALIGEQLPPSASPPRRVDPTVSDIFAGAAFRIGHTMVDNEIPRSSSSGRIAPIGMREAFFRPASTFSGSEMENFIRGVASTRAQEVDAKVVNVLRNQLFEDVPGPEGFDLVALNLQRGRDHALPTYNEIREIFGLPRARNFNDITSNSETAQQLSQAYNDNINEVEAFPGLLAEDHKRGSGVGETMATVWREEFTRLRDGDQFFFRNGRAFPDQLRTGFPDFIENLQGPLPNLFRDIIVRNSGISSSQLPNRIFFA